MLKGSLIRKSEIIYLKNLAPNSIHNKNKTKDSIVTNQTKFLSFPKPNGIGPIKPKTATFVLDFESFADINEPMNTIIKPAMISSIPSAVNCSILVVI